MLLNQHTLKGIRSGDITLAFRRWRRPTVKAGGTLLTRIGQLAIEAVDEVDPADITESDAAAAGFADLDSLRQMLSNRPNSTGRTYARRSATREGTVYRIRFSLAGPDPRIALRESVPDAKELDAIIERLHKMDARNDKPWTCRYLKIIRDRPGERAIELAATFGMEKAPFKTRVRRLKSLGLTVSLSPGYRLSPRGRAVLDRIGDCPDAT